MNFKILIIGAIFAPAIALIGCGDDETTGTGGGGGMGGSDMVEVDCNDIPDLTAYSVEGAPETTTDDCTGDIFEPTADSAADLNVRLNNADPGDVICMAPGTYEMNQTIKISLANEITLKGTGSSPDDTLLVFGGPGSGPGIEVSKNDGVIENLWVKNTGANAVVQDGTSGSVFRKLHVSWDDFCAGEDAPAECGDTCAPKRCDNDSDNTGDPCTADVQCTNGRCVDQDLKTECGDQDELICVATPGDATGECVADKGLNGAYGIYPTNCQDTLVEYCHASDASDAGIYVGKCGWEDDSTEGGIVRNNIVNGNVAGLEVENCLGVTVYDNLVIDNTGGLMPLQQPGASSAERPYNSEVLMENNKVWCNNHWNFAKVGVVEIIPVGSGLLMLGGNGIEVRNNDIQGNDTGAFLIVSNRLTCAAGGADCPRNICNMASDNAGEDCTEDADCPNGSCGEFGYADYNPNVENIYAHDNFYLNNGTNADQGSQFYIIFDILNVGTPDAPTPNVIWDGYIDPEGDGDPGICLGEDFSSTYTDLTNDMCNDVSSDTEFAACVATNNTDSTAGRLCSP